MINEEDFGSDSNDDGGSVKVLGGGKRRKTRRAREVVFELHEEDHGGDEDLEQNLGEFSGFFPY
jgi:hypothetical protein